MISTKAPRLAPVRNYQFTWSPTGQAIAVMPARSLEQARAMFYTLYPQFRRAKGEVSWRVVS